MFFHVLKAEQMKYKRSPVWLAFLLMPIIPAVLGTANYLANVELFQSQWYSLWTQHTLFTCYFFLPVMIGIYCAYTMRLEHGNQNWHKLLTMPVRRPLILLAKLLTVTRMIVFSELWIGVLFIVSGKMAGITAAVPYADLLRWCLFGALGGMVMASIQLLFSLYLKSFALPVGISFAGGISGLLFLAKGLGHIWPYSLMAYGMNSNAPQQMMASGYAAFILICLAYLAIFTALSCVVLTKKEM